MATYATAAEVKLEPEVPNDADDALVLARLELAEDRIDGWLGPWAVLEDGPSAGRKIAEASVRPWQWAKLKRATVRLAARLYAQPDLLDPPAHGKVAGPDFTVEQATPGVAMIQDVTSPLNASGLRILSARAA